MEPISDSDYSNNDSSSFSDNDPPNKLLGVHVSHHETQISEDDDSDSSADTSNFTNDAFQQSDDSKALWKGDRSLEELMAIRDKIGLKKFNKDVMNSSKPSSTLIQKKKHEIRRYKREHKRRPQELSSKIKVPLLRQVVNFPSSKFTPRDPRFDDLCGSQFDEEKFNKTYSFLDNIREREAKELKKMLDETTDSSKKKKLRYLLRRMKEQKRAKQHRNIMRQVEDEHRKAELEKIEKGIKKPYYLTKKKRKELYEQKKAELEKQEGSSNTKKSEVKKEKKLKHKEKKHMPFKRRLEH